MSRVGKHPIAVPSGVDVQIADQAVTVKGKNGQLSQRFSSDVEIVREDNLVWVRPRNETKRARMMWGTARSIVANLVHGVSQGFTVNLEIVGVGYRAQADAKTLTLQLGYSHEVRYPVPQGIQIVCPRPTAIQITGADRQQVGQVAAEIRGMRGPEPYKGKGIRYEGEAVRHKEGKKK